MEPAQRAASLPVMMAKDDGMVVLSTKLVCRDELHLDDLPRIEHPFFATSEMRRLPDDACYRVIRQMPHRFGSLCSSWVPLGYIRDQLAKALEQGEIFLLKCSPFKPVVRRRMDATDSSSNQWEYCGGEGHLFLRSAVEWLIYQLSQPWWGGGTPAAAAAAPPPDWSMDGDPGDVTEAVQRALPNLPKTPPFVTGLGSEVDAIAAKSPTLQAQLKQLDDRDWTFGYGKGPPSQTIYEKPAHIEISPDLRSRPKVVVQQLSHEIGHALHPNQWDTSSRAAYIDSALRGEGWATLNNISVQHEILAAGGPDIGVASASPYVLVPQYQAIYQQYTISGDANTAVNAIGQIYGQHEITGGGIPYADYYGGAYDRSFGH
jgi:hypothetical protein